MTPINWLALWFLASVVAAPFIGQWIHGRRTRNEFVEKRKARLEKLVELADQYDAAETDKERAKLYRKASALGFTDSDNDTEYESDYHPHPRAL